MGEQDIKGTTGTYIISEATSEEDLKACAVVIRTAFHDSPFHRIVWPESLRDRTITEEARVLGLANGLRREIETDNCTHFKASDSKGDIVGCATFRHPPKSAIHTATDAKESIAAQEKDGQSGPDIVSEEKLEASSTGKVEETQVEEHRSASKSKHERDDRAWTKLTNAWLELNDAHVNEHCWWVITRFEKYIEPEKHERKLIFVNRQVQRLTVLPAHERRGIGAQLIYAGLNKMSNMDSSVPVVVGASEKGAKVYERCGFIKLGEIKYTSERPGEEPINFIGPYMVFRK